MVMPPASGPSPSNDADDKTGCRDENQCAKEEPSLREELHVAIVGELGLVHAPCAMLGKSDPVASQAYAEQRVLPEDLERDGQVAGSQGEWTEPLVGLVLTPNF